MNACGNRNQRRKSTSNDLRSLILNSFKGEAVEGVECLNCSVIDAKVKAECDKNDLISLVKLMPTETVSAEIAEICRRADIFNELIESPELQSEVLGAELFNDVLSTIQRVKTKSFKDVIFSKWPPILCFHVCRVSFDVTHCDTVKNLSHIAFPLEFNPSKSLVDESNNIFSEKHTKIGFELPNCNYFLKCVVVHHGRDAAGSLIAKLKERLISIDLDYRSLYRIR